MEEAAKNNHAGVKELDRIKTITMLYDGALNFIRVARKKAEQGDTYGMETHIGKTAAIVSELDSALNMDGGEVAHNMKKLYAFIFNCLEKAKNGDDPRAFSDGEKVLEILRDAWYEMQRAARSF